MLFRLTSKGKGKDGSMRARCACAAAMPAGNKSARHARRLSAAIPAGVVKFAYGGDSVVLRASVRKCQWVIATRRRRPRKPHTRAQTKQTMTEEAVSAHQLVERRLGHNGIVQPLLTGIKNYPRISPSIFTQATSASIHSFNALAC